MTTDKTNEAKKITVTITCTPSAATGALLAIEAHAARVYFDRDGDPAMQTAYNALGDIVLPLRAARDAAYDDDQAWSLGGTCLCIGYNRRDCASAERCVDEIAAEETA